MKKVLLFPGAFNPPHQGHIALIQAALSQEHFDEAWIMPPGQRDDGKAIAINYEHRRNLNKLFTDYLRNTLKIPTTLITAELDDEKGLGTKEHIRRIKTTPEIEMIQLIGSDAYSNLLKHKLIVDGEKFLVFRRAGEEITYQLNEGDQFFDIELPSISSTAIRTMVQESDNRYKELVIKEIGDYIEFNKLYL